MPSIAAETRRVVDNTPFLRQALRAGIVNFTEAARQLEVPGETEAVASALRRYAGELPPLEDDDRQIRVRMDRGVDSDRVTVSGTDPGREDLTAIALEGTLGPGLFGRVLSAFESSDVAVRGAGLVDESGVVLVDRGAGSRALRLVEAVVNP
ncbi:MAG: hypothetical protein ACLFNC_00145 [Halodesulfurarchaeum sp.]